MRGPMDVVNAYERERARAEEAEATANKATKLYGEAMAKLGRTEAALAERDERIAELEGELRLMATQLRGMKDSRLVRNSTLERFAVRLDALSPTEEEAPDA